jgi:hypothetical protein
MVFYKNIEVRDLNTKYGGSQRGLFAMETIEPGEKIWYCECGEEDGTFTRAELLSIINKYPKLDYFVRSFSYMVDDDIYAMPLTYREEKNNDECALFNHSCNPNCGFDITGNCIMSLRTIHAGDELSYHYGFLETESSLIYGFECKCASANCDKSILFDYYRDQEFVGKYFDFFTPYLRKKVIDMQTRWYSAQCYLKRFNNKLTVNKEDWPVGLAALRDIKKDELVARFSTELISPDCHFIRNSIVPNCYVIDRDVFASVDIPSEAELTLYYHGILL